MITEGLSSWLKIGNFEGWVCSIQKQGGLLIRTPQPRPNAESKNVGRWNRGMSGGQNARTLCAVREKTCAKKTPPPPPPWGGTSVPAFSAVQ